MQKKLGQNGWVRLLLGGKCRVIQALRELWPYLRQALLRWLGYPGELLGKGCG